MDELRTLLRQRLRRAGIGVGLNILGICFVLRNSGFVLCTVVCRPPPGPAALPARPPHSVVPIRLSNSVREGGDYDYDHDYEYEHEYEHE